MNDTLQPGHLERRKGTIVYTQNLFERLFISS